MNQHQPVISQVPPAIPFPQGRQGQNVPYPQPPYPYYNYPPQYAYPYPQMQRPPQQWQPYQMPIPMGRAAPGYPPMNGYPPPQHYQQPMRPPAQQHPSSTSMHSKQGMLSSSPHTPQNPTPSAFVPPQIQSPQAPRSTPPPAPTARSSAPTRAPFHPPLPWQTFKGNFPPRKQRRRRKLRVQSANIELPPRPTSITEPEPDTPTVQQPMPPTNDATIGPLNLETPSTSTPPSEIMSTEPTTPTSSVAPQQATPKAPTTNRTSVPSVTIRPAIPNIPLPTPTTKKTATESVVSETAKPTASVIGEVAKPRKSSQSPSVVNADVAAEVPQPVKAATKSWADLVRSQAAPKAATSSTSGASAEGSARPNGVLTTKASSLTGVLGSLNINGYNEFKTAFLEPRGLVNTGNMCYMNSILQVLLFTVPFYVFLEKVGKQAAHSFQNDTPMMDAMIMFMREFKVIDAASSIDQLRMRLKDSELEQYGETFIPDFVYDVIRRLPRFSSMRRGHQQDAEEFLGFLLEELHDECSKAMRAGEGTFGSGASSPNGAMKSPSSEIRGAHSTDDSGWLEVGPKQRPATTRSSGAIATESPITKIFGGKLRSELRVPGMKSSVTLEPYQPLQLDIGAPHVNDILDALKGLTKPETLHGEFNSPRGPGSTATKQVTIETLPGVLILHLKRFQYDNTGGTQKVWKKVGYPLDLEIPKEVFAQHKRGSIMAHGGLPKYRLIGVVYHHGKNASGGHYTVDVRRQEGREWIRLDDTVIRRIRSEDVAAGGSEEDPKALAAALQQHKEDQSIGNTTANFYDQFAVETTEEQTKEREWSQVAEGQNGTGHAKKKSSHVTGNATPKASDSGKMTPVGRPVSIKDNKVAYILFYQRVNA